MQLHFPAIDLEALEPRPPAIDLDLDLIEIDAAWGTWTSSIANHQATAQDVLGGMRAPIGEPVNA